MVEKFLDKTYEALAQHEVTAHYDDWAASYDAEIAENGYATPGRCAEALARHLKDQTAPVLDFGCGTGLSGLALARAGFSTIDGIDPSSEMLEKARGRGVYRNLGHIAPGDDIPGKPGTFAAICAIGVIGVGAAPPSVMAQIMASLIPGGLFIFSLNDHALANAPTLAARDALISTGVATQIEETYGTHLPGINLNSSVYVFGKS